MSRALVLLYNPFLNFESPSFPSSLRLLVKWLSKRRLLLYCALNRHFLSIMRTTPCRWYGLSRADPVFCESPPQNFSPLLGGGVDIKLMAKTRPSSFPECLASEHLSLSPGGVLDSLNLFSFVHRRTSPFDQVQSIRPGQGAKAFVVAASQVAVGCVPSPSAPFNSSSILSLPIKSASACRGYSKVFPYSQIPASLLLFVDVRASQSIGGRRSVFRVNRPRLKSFRLLP